MLTSELFILQKSAQRHYNRQDFYYVANEKREGHERNTSRLEREGKK